MKIWIGLVVLALAVTSCTARASEQPGPTLKPLELAATPSWATSVPASRVVGMDVRDDLAVVSTGDHLVLADVTTGKVKWYFTPGTDLPGGDGIRWPAQSADVHLVEHDGGLAVLAEYVRTACPKQTCFGTEVAVSDERGLVLMSVEDGSVLVKTPVFLSEPMAQHKSSAFVVRAVDDRVAVVNTAPGGRVQRTVPREALQAVAYDIHTGKELWRLPGMWGVAITGDTLLVSVGENWPTSPPGWAELADSTVAALDVATGTRKWDLDDRFARSEVVVSGGELALVRGVADGKDEAEGVLVDAADGHELSRIGEARIDDCATDGQVVACKVPNGLDVYDAKTDELTGLDERPAGVDAVVAGRIFLSGANRSYTIDTKGNRIDKTLPGAVRAITPGHAVFGPLADAMDKEPVSVYGLTS